MQNKFFGELSVIGMRGSEDFVAWTNIFVIGADESFIVTPSAAFGAGEAKCAAQLLCVDMTPIAVFTITA